MGKEVSLTPPTSIQVTNAEMDGAWGMVPEATQDRTLSWEGKAFLGPPSLLFTEQETSFHHVHTHRLPHASPLDQGPPGGKGRLRRSWEKDVYPETPV